MGPLLGWTAARGRIEWPGVALFAILFVWQFPHFMAISWMYRDEYAQAGIRMLPVVQPDGWSTVAEALFFAVLMIPVSLAPWWLGMAGDDVCRAGRRAGTAYLAYTFASPGFCGRDETESRKLARDLLKVSVLYLPLLFTTLMLCAMQNNKRTHERHDDRSIASSRMVRYTARHRRHSADQRGGHPVSFLADLCSSRGGNERAVSHFCRR